MSISDLDMGANVMRGMGAVPEVEGQRRKDSDEEKEMTGQDKAETIMAVHC